MNTLNIKRANWIVATVLLALGGSGLTSCSKESSSEQVIEVDATKIAVNVTGITDEGSISTKSSTTPSKAQTPKIQSYPEFDATLSVDNQLPASPLALATDRRNGKASVSNYLQAASMDAGVKYRLFLYKTDGTLYSSTLLTSGTAGSLTVVPGTTYKWVALSYNNSDDVADVTTGSTEIALPGGKDILYSTGTISTGNPAGTAINISFNRKFARLGIELNTMGMFANMETANVSVSGLSVQTATIDLADGSLKTFVDYPQTINFSSFTDINAAYQDAKIAYIYTANDSKSDIKVAVAGLKIKLDDNSSREFTTTANFPFTTVTPVMGQSHRLLVNLIESPLTIENTKWARQNLYYTPGHNGYRFHHTYAHSQARNTYFSFKGTVPDQFGANGEPCGSVYPAGVWRTASEGDYRTLTGLLNIGGKTATYGTVGGNGYSEFTATGTAAPYPSNKLRFNYNGGSTAVGLVNGLVNITLGNFGTQSQYWTATSALGIPGLAGLGAWYYHGQKTLIGNNVNDDLSANLLTASVIGIDVLETQMKNIRCVRN